MKIYLLKIGIIEEAFTSREKAKKYAETFASEILNSAGVEWSAAGSEGRSTSSISGIVTKYQLTELIVK